MDNQGLTPEEFEILFGDVVRREIEMLSTQEPPGQAQPEEPTVLLDAPGAAAAPTAAGAEATSSPSDESQILVGPLHSDAPATPKRRWLSGALIALAMVGAIALAGFLAFQRQSENSGSATLTEAVTGEVEDDQEVAEPEDDQETAEAEDDQETAEAEDDQEIAEGEGDEAGRIAAAPEEGDGPDEARADDQLDVPEAEAAIAADQAEVPGTETDAPSPDATDPGAGEGGEVVEGAEVVAPESTTTTTNVTATTPAPAPVGSQVGAVAGTSVCQDPVGDVMLVFDVPDEPEFAAPAVTDLVEAELTVSATQVVVRWRTSEQVPTIIGQPGESTFQVGSYGVTLWSDDPSVVTADEPFRRVNLIADIGFGDLAAVSTGTDPSLRNNPGTGELALDGDSIVATFAIAALGDFPAEFNWTAFVAAGVLNDAVEPTNFASARDEACASFEDSGEPFPG